MNSIVGAFFYQALELIYWFLDKKYLVQDLTQILKPSYEGLKCCLKCHREAILSVVEAW